MLLLLLLLFLFRRFFNLKNWKTAKSDSILFLRSNFVRLSHSESESVFAPKLLSCVLLSSPDCLAGMEASHGVLQTVSEHLGGGGEEEDSPTAVIDREAIYLRRMLAATSDGGGRLSLPKGTEVSLEDVGEEKDTFDGEEEEDFMVKRQGRRRRGNSGGNQVRDSLCIRQSIYPGMVFNFSNFPPARRGLLRGSLVQQPGGRRTAEEGAGDLQR